MKRDWQGKRVIVIGAARQGLAASRYLATKGALVTLTDSKSADQLGDSLSRLNGAPVALYLGSHPFELLDKADILCISGGVPLTIPFIQEANRRGIPLTNDAQLFMEETTARVIGITGSAGKTTTTTLVGEIAKAAMGESCKVWVGGNIGYPLVEHLDEINTQDWVVHEFSSFQLEQMTVSPHVAVITNITPNHLDRHKTMDAYTTAKMRILEFQRKGDWAVLNREDPGSKTLNKTVKDGLITFGYEKLAADAQGVFSQGGEIWARINQSESKLVDSGKIHLPGRHNLANAMAACAACLAAGFSAEAMEKGIESVKGIPHRLELVHEKDGVRWINDSIATAPERVMAALNAIDGNVVLLLGGRDKDLPWQDLAAMLHKRQPKVIVFGEAAGLVAKALRSYENGHIPYPLFETGLLDEAVSKAVEIALPGDSVLLSPGGTSYDAYLDFEARGTHFETLVKELA